jgi:hypothetical protein
MTPTMLGLGAGILTLIAGLASFVPILLPTSRRSLTIHSWLVFAASIALLVVGLKIWTLTLDEKNNILDVWDLTNSDTIAALEERVPPCF